MEAIGNTTKPVFQGSTPCLEGAIYNMTGGILQNTETNVKLRLYAATKLKNTQELLSQESRPIAEFKERWRYAQCVESTSLGGHGRQKVRWEIDTE